METYHLHLTFVIYVRVRSVLAAPRFETNSNSDARSRITYAHPAFDAKVNVFTLTNPNSIAAILSHA